MNLSVATYSSKGGRHHNEDAIGLTENGKSLVAVIADGLGGHSSGEKASQLAASTVNKSLAHSSMSIALLEASIQKANTAILSCDAFDRGMKSTLAVLWIEGSMGIAATVGDTRVYQIRSGRIIFQSKDHSIAQVEVEHGTMTVNEIRSSPYRHHLTRALGSDSNVKPDISELAIMPGDSLLLCSDGVWGEVTEHEMLRLHTESADPTEWLVHLKECVQDRAKTNSDNHSAIAIQVIA